MNIGEDSWKEKFKSIVIEGPIGVGKTSLTTKIAERYSYTPILEAAEENPFLEKFYKDSTKYAFPTQLFFLFQRLDQLGILSQRDLFSKNIISDFMLEKDAIFASLTLTDDELLLYQKIYSSQSAQVAVPDLIIFLQATPEKLSDRIKKRGIPMEQRISYSYLEQLCSAYNKFFYQYEHSPILIINTVAFDPINNEDDFKSLLNQIKKFKGRRSFFNMV
ncbi:MAG: deoxynucleoside kinase [Betaproteobacteria bacterium TMED82]|nr:MAG: deoxynucleoside kinase [Betaproteobacteria bacterium TMED82]|tara:strand:+ start:37229 stop:37885 length:657 start_codon:yes stop_codon:yes gene_type:complete